MVPCPLSQTRRIFSPRSHHTAPALHCTAPHIQPIASINPIPIPILPPHQPAHRPPLTRKNPPSFSSFLPCTASPHLAQSPYLTLPCLAFKHTYQPAPHKHIKHYNTRQGTPPIRSRPRQSLPLSPLSLVPTLPLEHPLPARAARHAKLHFAQHRAQRRWLLFARVVSCAGRTGADYVPSRCGHGTAKARLDAEQKDFCTVTTAALGGLAWRIGYCGCFGLLAMDGEGAFGVWRRE